MDAGEGIRAVGFVIGLGVGLWAFVAIVGSIGRHWQVEIDRWPSDAEDARAEALVPGFAADRRAPTYRGGCGCRHCRSRATVEPCSDFDQEA